MKMSSMTFTLKNNKTITVEFGKSEDWKDNGKTLISLPNLFSDCCPEEIAKVFQTVQEIAHLQDNGIQSPLINLDL